MRPQVNKDGTIVTLDGVEYRMRDGEVQRRNAIGDLKPVLWHDVPRAVKDVFIERTF